MANLTSQAVDKPRKCAKKASQSSPKAKKFKSIFARACTAQKYREPGNVRRPKAALSQRIKIKANARGIRFESVYFPLSGSLYEP